MKVKSYSSREVIKMLEDDGWFLVKCVGSHHQFKHPTKTGKTTVKHPEHDIPRKTLDSIERQSALLFRGAYMEKPNYYFYPAVFGYEPNEKISVFFPDLDVATSGDNDKDALKSARELLGLTMWGMEDDGEPIPAPSPLNSIKLSENEFVFLVDVFMPSIRMAGETKEKQEIA